MPQAAVRAAVAGGLQPLPRLWQEHGIILVALPPFGLGKVFGAARQVLACDPNYSNFKKVYWQL